MIPVTRPFSPPIEEYQRYIEEIWKRNWFTNNGPLVNDLELKIKEHLNLKHLLYVGNGTIAIQIALRALGISKKVITTPFSYVATTSSLVWENCTPVYVDIDPNTFNIDPSKIENAIDNDTEAILATHCFGNPCDVNEIDRIAKKHGLKVIYDAAHCFGVEYLGRSIFNYGDVSAVSFHATKLFHTVEGGGIFCNSIELTKKMAHMRNFGHDGPERFSGVGINGKNSEFHAAMGLINLKYVKSIIKRRRDHFAFYQKELRNLNVQQQTILEHTKYNYAYYPIVFETEDLALKMKETLEKQEIFPRRYFYPSLDQLEYVEGTAPLANSIASRILCLPLYYDLSNEEISFIARLLLRCQNY